MLERLRASRIIHLAALSGLAIGIIARQAESGGGGQIPCRYEVEILPLPGISCGQPFGPPATTPAAISDGGVVVGHYNQCATSNQEAWAWFGSGPIVTLQRPPGVIDAEARAVNDSRQIVGVHSNTTTGLGFTGFLWQHGVWTDLGAPPWATNSEALGTNSMGVTAGWIGNFITGPSSHPAVWHDKELLDLTNALGHPRGAAHDVNNHGLVTGWMGTSLINDARAFIWDGKGVIELGPVPGGTTSQGFAINDASHVAVQGRHIMPDSTIVIRSFLWDGQRMIDLGTLSGTSFTRAMDVNDADMMVGFCHNAQLTGQVPFIWHNGVLRNLRDLIDPMPGFTLNNPAAIDSSGRIVCKATFQNNTRSVILTPVMPQPGDLNCDSVVNGIDLGVVLASWSIPPGMPGCRGEKHCSADLNADGVVNGLDLGILLANWSVP